MTHLAISEVERETGVSKDTLRIWERRYGFPVPERDEAGNRRYPAEQVERLKLIQRLLALGHRPHQVVGLSDDALDGLAAAASPGASESPEPELADALDALARADAVELAALLGRELVTRGLKDFVLGFAAPLTTRVGQAWAAGSIAIHHEHLFSEQLARVLRHAIGSVPGAEGDPRILLTTLPGEQHTLGLLMLETVLAATGARCISLGTQTPVSDVAEAARLHGAEIVAVSVSANAPLAATRAALVELRRLLPEGVRLWAGGRGAPEPRHLPAGVERIVTLEDAPAALHAPG